MRTGAITTTPSSSVMLSTRTLHVRRSASFCTMDSASLLGRCMYGDRYAPWILSYQRLGLGLGLFAVANDESCVVAMAPTPRTTAGHAHSERCEWEPVGHHCLVKGDSIPCRRQYDQEACAAHTADAGTGCLWDAKTYLCHVRAPAFAGCLRAPPSPPRVLFIFVRKAIRAVHTLTLF
jgi:hypothetical protein